MFIVFCILHSRLSDPTPIVFWSIWRHPTSFASVCSRRLITVSFTRWILSDINKLNFVSIWLSEKVPKFCYDGLPTYLLKLTNLLIVGTEGSVSRIIETTTVCHSGERAARKLLTNLHLSGFGPPHTHGFMYWSMDCTTNYVRGSSQHNSASLFGFFFHFNISRGRGRFQDPPPPAYPRSADTKSQEHLTQFLSFPSSK